MFGINLFFKINSKTASLKKKKKKFKYGHLNKNHIDILLFYFIYLTK